MAIVFDKPGAVSNVLGSQFSMFHTVPINVVNSEVHSLRQRVTSKPVEGGAVVSDNIIILPTTVKISGILSGDILRGVTLNDKFESLKELRKTREPFTLVTSLDVYRDMFFDGEITINRDASNIKVISFDATLIQINIIESLTTIVPAASVAQINDAKGARSRAPKNELGKKTASNVNETTKQQEKSWIVGLTG